MSGPPAVMDGASGVQEERNSMPDENPTDSASEAPPQEPLAGSNGQDGSNQNPPANIDEGGAPDAQDRPDRLEQDIRSGERWLIGITAAGVAINICIACFYYSQLGQMREATEAATKAADVASDSFEISQGNFDRTMSQMIAQTTQQVAAANAARSAARTAQEALFISDRAYIVTGLPDVNYAGKFVTVPIQNLGRIPSRKVEFVTHEATIDVADPSLGSRFDQAIDKGCTRGEFDTLTPNLPQYIEIPTNQMSGAAMEGGHQLTVVAIDITYDDGFPDTQKQTFQFCMRTQYAIALHKTNWRSCNAKLHIPALVKVDGYPNCTEAGIDR
jgi:hypothetical protein